MGRARKPPGPVERWALQETLKHLQEALKLAGLAESPTTLARIRAAMTSVRWAIKSVDRRSVRTESKE
jgi:hypothetical protein